MLWSDPNIYNLIEQQEEPLGYGLTMVHNHYEVIDAYTDKKVDDYWVPIGLK